MNDKKKFKFKNNQYFFTNDNTLIFNLSSSDLKEIIVVGFPVIFYLTNYVLNLEF